MCRAVPDFIFLIAPAVWCESGALFLSLIWSITFLTVAPDAHLQNSGIRESIITDAHSFMSIK